MSNLQYTTGHGASALDQQQERDRLDGYAVVSGYGVSPGTGLEVSVASGTALFGVDANGNANTVSSGSSQTVALASADTDPRKDVIYVQSDGTVTKETGVARSPLPSGATRFQTYQPEPYSMHDIEGVVLAEVWVGAGETSLSTNDIRDRRMSATATHERLVSNEIVATSAEVDEINNVHHVDPDVADIGAEINNIVSNASDGAVIVVPPGTHDLDTTINWQIDGALIGPQGGSYPASTPVIQKTSDVPILETGNSFGSQLTLRNLRFDSTLSDTTQGVIIHSRFRLDNISVKNMGSHGIHLELLSGGNMNQSEMEDVEVGYNSGDGVRISDPGGDRNLNSMKIHISKAFQNTGWGVNSDTTGPTPFGNEVQITQLEGADQSGGINLNMQRSFARVIYTEGNISGPVISFKDEPNTGEVVFVGTGVTEFDFANQNNMGRRAVPSKSADINSPYRGFDIHGGLDVQGGLTADSLGLTPRVDTTVTFAGGETINGSFSSEFGASDLGSRFIVSATPENDPNNAFGVRYTGNYWDDGNGIMRFSFEETQNAGGGTARITIWELGSN